MAGMVWCGVWVMLGCYFIAVFSYLKTVCLQFVLNAFVRNAACIKYHFKVCETFLLLFIWRVVTDSSSNSSGALENLAVDPQSLLPPLRVIASTLIFKQSNANPTLAGETTSRIHTH